MPSHSLSFPTRGDGHITDLTREVMRVAEGAELVNVFAVGSTAAVTTMEHEPGGVHDLQALLDLLVPREGDYEHNRLNHDTNSHAHMKAAIVGPSLTVPVGGLGTWQQIVHIDFDDRPRERTVLVTPYLPT